MPPFVSPQGPFNGASRQPGRGVDAPVDDQGQTLLHIAVERGDTVAAVRLLNLDANPNQMDSNGRTPLYNAIETENFDIVAALLKRGATFATEDDSGHTPLMWAVQKKVSPAFFGALREAGMDIHQKNRIGRTALHAAALTNSTEMVDYLVRQGIAVDAIDQDGKSALHAAADRGAADAIARLIEAGANPVLRNRDIKTPLHIAAARGDVASTRILLALPEVRRSINDFQTYVEGWTPLMEAVVANRTEVARLLLDVGADANQRDNKNRHSLFLAVERGYPEMTGLLIAAGADVVKAPRPSDNAQSLLQAVNTSHYKEVLFQLCRAGADIDEKDALGQTALYKAADQKDAAKIRTLLELGADPNEPNNAGRRPIDAAVVAYAGGYYGYESQASSPAVMDAVSALLAYGANPGLAPSGLVPSAPLHVAARAGRTDLVKLLLEHGAAVDESDRNTGLTPWLAAVSNRNTAVAEMLVKAGADTSRKDRGGRGVLHIAALGGAKAILDSFLKLPSIRAAINETDTTGATPLHIAVRNQKVDCVATLIAAGASATVPDATGQTPLHLAAGSYNESVFAAFETAQGKQRVDWNVQTATDKDTPLHIAARTGYRGVVDRLLRLGASATVRNARGFTPLAAAVEADQYATVSSILSHMKAKNLSIDEQRDAQGRTPLHIAALRWSAQMASLLAGAGADVNARTAEGDTPLHIAVRENRPEVVRYLLTRPVDLAAANAMGATPLDLAMDGNRTDIADLIRAEQVRRNPPPPTNFRKPPPFRP